MITDYKLNVLHQVQIYRCHPQRGINCIPFACIFRRDNFLLNQPTHFIHGIVTMIYNVRHNSNHRHQSIWLFFTKTILHWILNHWNVVKKPQIRSRLRHLRREYGKFSSKIIVTSAGLYRRYQFRCVTKSPHNLNKKEKKVEKLKGSISLRQLQLVGLWSHIK